MTSIPLKSVQIHLVQKCHRHNSHRHHQDHPVVNLWIHLVELGCVQWSVLPHSPWPPHVAFDANEMEAAPKLGPTHRFLQNKLPRDHFDPSASLASAALASSFCFAALQHVPARDWRGCPDPTAAAGNQTAAPNVHGAPKGPCHKSRDQSNLPRWCLMWMVPELLLWSSLDLKICRIWVRSNRPFLPFLPLLPLLPPVAPGSHPPARQGAPAPAHPGIARQGAARGPTSAMGWIKWNLYL